MKDRNKTKAQLIDELTTLRGRNAALEALVSRLQDDHRQMSKREENFERSTEVSRNAIMLTRPDGVVSFLSPTCRMITGYDYSDFLGKDILRSRPGIVHPDDLHKAREVFHQALHTSREANFQYRIRTKSGETKWVSHYWSSVYSDNHLQAILSVVSDLTNQRTSSRDLDAFALYTFDDIVGEDEAFQRCVETLKLASRADCAVLLTGESGTGKEVFAQAVHNYSDRRAGPFVPINCAALPKDLFESEIFGYEEGAFTGARKSGNPGKFELSANGSIFLDQIESMPLEIQAKLLRVIEEKRVLRLGGKKFTPLDIRIVSASNRDLEERIREGRFRADLYYRINTVSVSIPPLRERRKDVPLLAKHFWDKESMAEDEAQHFLEPSILERLRTYDWPGNVRELSNWVRRVRALGTIEDPIPIRTSTRASFEPIKDRDALWGGHSVLRISEAEELCIRRAILKNRGVLSKAAADLGIGRATLYRKMFKYGISLEKEIPA